MDSDASGVCEFVWNCCYDREFSALHGCAGFETTAFPDGANQTWCVAKKSEFPNLGIKEDSDV